MDFIPFVDECSVTAIGGLQIENRLDRISFSGSLDITRDKVGLARLLELQALVRAALVELSAADLPEQVPLMTPVQVQNPFAEKDGSGQG